jgi:valyl-tRNA synthetase
MIMLGIECTGDVPFREVHMHGLVRDAERQKMSKTKGNVVDPLDLMDHYGTDACRIALLLSASSGADIALKMDRFEASRSFANKLWNASRLLFMNMERAGITAWNPDQPADPLSIEDAWIEERFNACAAIVGDALAVHRYHEAAQTLWDFIWKEFCDWYLEVKKLRFDSHALSLFERTLRLLHPFMPFVTEELWQRLMSTSSAPHARSISLAPYPKPGSPSDDKQVDHFRMIQRIVTSVREMRADNKVDPKFEVESTLQLRDTPLPQTDVAVIENLAKVKITQSMITDTADVTPPFTLLMRLPSRPNGTASRARLEKDNARLEKGIESLSRQLADETFVNKAPAHVMDAMRAKLAEYQAQLKKNRDLLDSLE